MATPSQSKDTILLPSPPFLNIGGIYNFRDLGGYPISPTKSIRRGYIFRCAEPTNATEEGINKLQSLDVTHIYDLRSNPEIAKHQVSGSAGKVTAWPGVERVYCPVFPEDSYDPASLAVRYADFSNPNPEVTTVSFLREDDTE